MLRIIWKTMHSPCPHQHSYHLTWMFHSLLLLSDFSDTSLPDGLFTQDFFHSRVFNLITELVVLNRFRLIYSFLFDAD